MHPRPLDLTHSRQSSPRHTQQRGTGTRLPSARTGPQSRRPGWTLSTRTIQRLAPYPQNSLSGRATRGAGQKASKPTRDPSRIADTPLEGLSDAARGQRHARDQRHASPGPPRTESVQPYRGVNDPDMGGPAFQRGGWEKRAHAGPTTRLQPHATLHPSYVRQGVPVPAHTPARAGGAESRVHYVSPFPQTSTHAPRECSDSDPAKPFSAALYGVAGTDYKRRRKKKRKGKSGENHSTQDSRVVPHRGTNWAAPYLTAQIGRDAVLSESYGRGCHGMADGGMSAGEGRGKGTCPK